MIAAARLAAYDILTAITSGRSDLPSAIAHVRTRLSDDRDRALAADIATGVQRWRQRLDYLISHFARRATDRLDPEVLDILRLSLYQLLHLSRVPASAVVDDAVKLTGKAGKRSAGGLVNAVLRAASRERTKLPLPARPDPQASRDAHIHYLNIAGSHPRWLVERWLDRVGFERADAWTTFNNHAAPLSLRTNRLRTTRPALQQELQDQGIITRAGAYAPDALLVESGQPLRTALERDGWFVVQDEGSQLITLLAGERPGPALLDLCAAPGGKTTAFAANLATGGRITACDVRDRRMTLLARTVSLTGAAHVRLVQADATHALPFQSAFDTVVVDAPCSGLGTLRRDPDIRWRRQATDLPRLAEAQQLMLRHAAAHVAPGGRLVYATCSSEPEENEIVAERFLRETSAFHLLDARQAHPALDPSLVDARGFFRSEPDRHGLEGFFGAVFERARES